MTMAHRASPTQEQQRAMIERRVCPWCDTGPWKSVAMHIAHKHGLDAVTLKAALGIPPARSLDAPEVTSARRVQGRVQYARRSPSPRPSDAELERLCADGVRLSAIAGLAGVKAKTVKDWIYRARRADPGWDPVRLARLDGLLTVDDVVDRLRSVHGLSTTSGTWHWWQAEHGAPRPVRFVTRAGMWSAEAVDAWVRQRARRYAEAVTGTSDRLPHQPRTERDRHDYRHRRPVDAASTQDASSRRRRSRVSRTPFQITGGYRDPLTMTDAGTTLLAEWDAAHPQMVVGQ